ncbi:MAG: hypothetical protein ACK4ND_00875 [Cytophagaceae bacterium]
MKNYLIPTLVFFVIVLNTHNISAQEIPEKRNEIGLDVSRIFGHTSNNNIMYRRHGEKGAFRLTTSFNFNVINHENAESGHNHYASLAVGHQFNKTFNKWRFYYGADAYGSISSGKTVNIQTHWYNDQPTEFSQTWQTQSIFFGLRPILGISYLISDRISVSLENALNIGYTINETIEGSNPNRPFEIERSSNSIGVSYNPLNVLMLSFHF